MSRKPIIVLGGRGMLGQMVTSYFAVQGFEVIEYNERIDEKNIFNVIEKINHLEAGILINCIGKIPQKTSDAFSLLWSNAILPLELSRSLKPEHILIHPSTDCVFSGDTSTDYKTYEFQDAQDVYGWSKSLGENALRGRPNTLIIRVSIIGPDIASNKGLFSWFLNLEKGSKVSGYTDHFWNGITTLEWCKFIYEYINSGFAHFNEFNILQLGTAKVHSKYEMLLMFNDVFNKEILINPQDTGRVVRKSLRPDITRKHLKGQLQELKDFLLKQRRI